MFDFKNWLKTERNGLKNDFYAYPKRKVLWIILVITLLFSTIFRLWTLVSFQKVIQWDAWLVSHIAQFRSDALNIFFLILTNFASIYFIIAAFLILAIFLIKKRMRKAAFSVFITLFGSVFFIWFLKNFFSRSRPFGCLSGQDCFSFPSGHATIAFYFYGLLFYLIGRFLKLKKITAFWWGLFFAILIFLIAISRIYLGHHFLTDIIGGLLLGGIFLLIAALLIDFLYQ